MRMLVAIITLIIYSEAFAGQVLTIGSGEWAPYQSERLRSYGYASKIVVDSFKQEGFDVKFKFYKSWARSMKNAQIGELAGTFLWGHKPEREEDFFFSKPIVDVQYVLFYKKSSKITWETPRDLKGLKIAITSGYYYGPEFDRAIKDGTLTVKQSTSDEANFRKLVKGQVDIAINDLDAGLDILRRNHLNEIDHISSSKKYVRKTPHYLLISKKYPNAKHIVESFNRGLKSLQKTGKFDAIIESSRKGEFSR